MKVGKSPKYHAHRKRRNAREINRMEPIYLTVCVSGIICGYRSIVLVSTYLEEEGDGIGCSQSERSISNFDQSESRI